MATIIEGKGGDVVRHTMLNGGPKAMLIECIDGRVVLVGPRAERHECLTLGDAVVKAKGLQWEIHIEHLFGGAIRRKMAEMSKEKREEA
jgi:hypothetical protein